MANLTTAQLIQNAGGEIQVLHATAEQVAQLQQTHQIQILQGEQVFGVCVTLIFDTGRCYQTMRGQVTNYM